MRGHKFQKTHTMQSIFSEDTRSQLEINKNKISLQIQNIWKLNNMPLIKPGVKGEITMEILKIIGRE